MSRMGRAVRTAANAEKMLARERYGRTDTGRVAQGTCNMSEISNIHQLPWTALVGNKTTVNTSAETKCSACYPEGDVVEISSLNRNDALVTEQSSLRAAKVAAIKKEVIAGTYETPWRIRGTVERLLDVIA